MRKKGGRLISRKARSATYVARVGGLALFVTGLAAISLTIAHPTVDRARAQTSDGVATTSLKIVQRLSRPPNVTGLAWSPDGSKLATFSDYTSVITIWDASDWHIVNEFSRYSAAYAGNAFYWLPNGLILGPAAARAPDENRFSMGLWDPNTGTLVRNIPGPTDEKSLQHNQASILAVSRDGSKAAMANYRNLRQAFVFETQAWTITMTLALHHIPTTVSFAEDGRLAIGSTAGQLYIFDLASPAPIRTITAYEGKPGQSVTTTAFSPDGAFLATAPAGAVNNQPLDGGPIRIWKADIGEQIAALGDVKDDQTFPQIAWSPDGSQLAAVSFSGLFGVWRFGASPAPLFTTHFSHAGYAIGFSRNGTLATAVGDSVYILK